MTALFGFSRHNHMRVFAIAIPMILSNIAAPLLGLVDTAIIGHLPQSIYLSAVALGAMIVSFIYLLAIFLRMTTTGVIAQAFGARDRAAQLQLTNHAIWFAIGLGIVVIVLSPWLMELAWFLTTPGAELKTFANSYIQIRLYAAPAALINLVVLGVLLGCQQSRLAMILVVFTNAVNVAADLILIVGLDMNVAGAAWASVTAEVSTAALGLYFLHRVLGYRLQFRLDKQLLFRLMGMNRDVFIRSLVLQLCLATMTGYATRYGHTVVAANAVLMQFLLLISLGLDGIAYAIEALVGAAKGQGQPRRIRYWCNLTLLWSVLFACVYSLVFALFGSQIIGLLTDLPEVIRTAEAYLPWLIVLPLLAHWSYFYDGIFIGLGLTAAMRNTMLAAAVLVFVPLWWIGQSYANHGLWLALAGFLTARGVAQAVWLRIYKPY
ncbi:multidrug resistance protein, MATE family [Pseudidiomarina planktonica]|uniref:Multidrug resistance protein, MATE family n=1 Tax=Pseudidiomarina planktonica TaxID=1323738 RepID=A0A1Y6EHP2_9GAMM|nr:MATE family efflux transporter [Pseudidiomarina planktonica]RUO66209.1 MATE family efflux transporter [Pseudidiomarina planktonica]SMQ59673.1 multidrug resistance protein, MATE family [Pseudidiomarina planktonica]